MYRFIIDFDQGFGNVIDVVGLFIVLYIIADIACCANTKSLLLRKIKVSSCRHPSGT